MSQAELALTTTCRECGNPVEYRGHGRPRSLCESCYPETPRYPARVPMPAHEVPAPLSGLPDAPYHLHDPETSRAAGERALRGGAEAAIRELMADGRARILAEVVAVLAPRGYRSDTVSSAWTRAKRHLARTGKKRASVGGSLQEEWGLPVFVAVRGSADTNTGNSMGGES